MPTSAEIAARKAALALIKDGFNATANSVNAGSDALKPFKAEYQSLIGSFNDVVDPQNVLGPAILEAIRQTDLLVPSDPPPPFGAWFVPPLTLAAGSSIQVTQYYNGPPGIFGANNLPAGVTIDEAGLLTAAADAPASNSTVTFTRSDASVVTHQSQATTLTVVGKAVVPSGGALTLKLRNTAGTPFWFSSGALLSNGKIYQPWADGTRMWDAATGDLVITPAQHFNPDGTPLASTQVENSSACEVPAENAIYHGTCAPGGPYYRFLLASGLIENVAATSLAHSAFFHDSQFNRVIAVGGFIEGPTKIYAWPLPMARLSGPASQGALLPITGDMPMITNPAAVYTDYRASISSHGRISILADANELYELTPSVDGNSYAGVHRPTTGEKPPTFSACICYEPWDAYIAACGANGLATNADLRDAFWILPRATWRWDPLVVNMPVEQAMASLESNIILSDPERSQIIVINCRGRFHTMDMRGGAVDPPVYPPIDPPIDPPPPPPPPPPVPLPVKHGYFGLIESFALDGNANAPFSINRSSKQVGMAWLRGKLYVGNGDWLRSATQGWWEAELSAAVKWKQLRPDAVPTESDPYPDSLQDGCGMFPDEEEGSILITPGGYYAYHFGPSGTKEGGIPYARGTWKWLVATDKFTQDLRIFGRDQWNVGTGLTTSMSSFGGVRDKTADHDHLLVFNDEANSPQGKGVTTYDLIAGTSSFALFPPNALTAPAGQPGAVVHNFTRSRATKIGRSVCFVGFSTDPSTGYSCYRLWEWHLDNKALREMATPPVGVGETDIYINLLADNGKLVLFLINGPGGGIGHYEPDGTYVIEPMKTLVYDPAINSWMQETGLPASGNWGGNTFCESPLGIIIAGNASGMQPSHIHRYRVNP